VFIFDWIANLYMHDVVFGSVQ